MTVSAGDQRWPIVPSLLLPIRQANVSRRPRHLLSPSPVRSAICAMLQLCADTCVPAGRHIGRGPCRRANAGRGRLLFRRLHDSRRNWLLPRRRQGHTRAQWRTRRTPRGRPPQGTRFAYQIRRLRAEPPSPGPGPTSCARAAHPAILHSHLRSASWPRAGRPARSPAVLGSTVRHGRRAVSPHRARRGSPWATIEFTVAAGVGCRARRSRRGPRSTAS